MSDGVMPYRDVFPQCLQEYLEQLKEAVRQKKHHDHRLHLFLDFLRKGFDLDPTEVELEHKIKVAQVRSRIDALFKAVIFEFKTDLESELDAARVELRKYFQSRSRPTDYMALVTDGITFLAFQFEKNDLRQIARFSLDSGDALTAFRLLDQFIFSSKPVSPRSADITNRFGLHSAVFNTSRRLLAEMYAEVEAAPSVTVKFREWNALLARVYGSGVGDTTLFLKHTYLTMLSRLLVARALVPQTERRPSDYAGLLSGEFFKAQGLLNLAEPDFFSWAYETAQQRDFFGFLARLESYLRIFDLNAISEDILKEIYQELVDPESRHALGEYYTPDWLADLTLDAISYESGRLLDPACGSGSFLLAAIRRKRAQEMRGRALLDFATESVVGIDVHPLAVLMTKANLILALVQEIRKSQRDLYFPVYMADTLMVSEDAKGERIVVRISDDEEFNIPLETVRRQAELDPLVDAVTSAARVAAGDEKKSERALVGLQKNELATMSEREGFFWKQNFKLMARLIGAGRDTVFGYILKNAYRPAFLRQSKVDFVVGNPPWLAYRYVQDAGYRSRIKKLVFDSGLLQPKEVKLFTHMDTSTLFFVYCERAFLKPGGTIAFVLPKTVVLPAKQHAGFQAHGVSEIHDFTDVSPLFNVRAVMVVRRPGRHLTSDIPAVFYKGVLPTKNMTWQRARPHLTIEKGTLSFLDTQVRSPHYYERFLQGATLVPRCMWFVQPQKGAARNVKAPHLETSDEAYEEAKDEWRLRFKGQIEREFLFETVLGKGLLPFWVARRELVFLPIRVLRDGPVMADTGALLEAGALHAAEWMQRAEKAWAKARKGKEEIELHEWLNYTQKIVKQDVTADRVVLYNSSGTNITAAVFESRVGLAPVLPTKGFVTDSVTYYFYPSTRAEGDYLCAVLNSDIVNDLIKVFQPQGLYGERHIQRLPFEVCAIPPFNRSDARHVELARLAHRCAGAIAKHGPSLTGTLGRRRTGARVLIADEMSRINALVNEILREGGQTRARPVRRVSGSSSLLLFDILK